MLTIHFVVSLPNSPKMVLHVAPFQGHWSRVIFPPPERLRMYMIKCRVDMAAESPRSMESWIWRHIYTSTHSWQVSLQHLLYPSLWLGLVKLCISWSNSSVYQVFLHSSDPFKSPALYPLPPLCGSSSAIWGQLSCPQGALSSPGNPQELMWPLHLQWQ